ncbi:hypothetical protein HF675_03510 [Serratia sp. JUb9]|uniref:hypothetical protein n=1 Tax=unclassified Serratia (in: enterobacteria) TaxID=2647522 RepID=UPI001319E9E2|nr:MULTISPECIES: hypothetical protein [unclassified Serratia (in: enterobacteria)]QNK33147.1 hypothetical protein HF675_03510 [Serratia sp. JUb9]
MNGIRVWRWALLGGVLCSFLPPAGAEQARGVAAKAKIQALTCVLTLSVDGGEQALNWRAGLTVRPDGSTRVVGGPSALRRQVVVAFQNPEWHQVDPMTGEPVDCSSARNGVGISFAARDTPLTLNQPHKDARMGLIPAATPATPGETSGYFEYYVTYVPSVMQAAAGSDLLLEQPPDSAQYRNEQVMPLHGLGDSGEMRLMFRPGAAPAHKLGRYPFNVWLEDNYTDPQTAPRADMEDNRYLSSLTVTATWL